ncbi:MAG: tripartite tricarboxylate transporter substrate binding protein [Comamonadaceae bacterium]|nr:tripartite tricarboxylate transporter substrate binding protein [Comamonadaceae bacterium]
MKSSTTREESDMSIDRRTLNLAAMAALWGAAFIAPAHADGYPGRPVTIIVPTPAGGASDTAARLVAKSLAAAWAQPVVVENRPGASGAIAAQAVMAAPPDGYTLLWAQASMAGLPFVQKGAPYQAMGELTPVSNVVQLGYALFVHRELPVQNFADLVAYGRAHPGQLHFATGSLGEYMMAAHVLKAVGVQARRVPYKGGAQLMPDLISGQVQINFGPISGGLQHARAGTLRMLATALPQRSPLLPDVPTLAELGIPRGPLAAWNALFAPPGTPKGIADAVSVAVAQALQAPAVREPLRASGIDPLGSTPQQLADAVEAATTAWQAFVRDYGIAQE